MTTIEEGLGSYLAGYSGLTAIISTRVYSIRKPQTVTLPCLTYQRIDTPRIITHDTAGASGTASPRFQFDAWADTYKVAKSIVDQLRAALNGKKGSIGSGENTITIQAAIVQGEEPELDPPTNTYRARSDYIIWHTE